MNGTMGFLLAVGGVSTIIYWLSNRADRAARRSSTGDGSGSSYDTSTSSIGGWSFTNWFSSSNSSSDSSSTSGASGDWSSSSDSSGGGDSGGGGDGGGD